MTFPARGRLLGIDYGTVRVGVAVCDADRKVASPLEVHRRTNADDVWIRKLVDVEEAVGFVVGLAISLNGTEGPKAKECRDYAAWLTQTTGLPHEFQDERFTTHYAEDVLTNAGLKPQQRKEARDMIAAQAILHVWLEGLDRLHAAS